MKGQQKWSNHLLTLAYVSLHDEFLGREDFPPVARNFFSLRLKFSLN
jgi:hypothetical protein